MDKSHVIPKMIMKIRATSKADSSEATLSDIVQWPLKRSIQPVWWDFATV